MVDRSPITMTFPSFYVIASPNDALVSDVWDEQNMV